MYAEAEAATERVRVAEEDLFRANDDLNAAIALVEAGREAHLRISQAQANVGVAEAVLESAHANLVDALQHLSALSGAKEAYTSSL